jgi:type I restriction enzyme S subunit
LIRQWRAFEPWIANEDAEFRHSHHALMPLRKVVCPRREAVVVNGEFGDWLPITVHLDGEISVRARSAPYKGAMFAAYPGDIVFSKIDARSGAIGMLPATIAKAAVTAEFPVFVGNSEKLDSNFVQRVLRTSGFLTALRSKATGTSGRKRITPEAFLDLRVPLPALDEQRAIVAAYDAAMADAAAKECAADAAEAQAMVDFEAALGFAPPVPLPDRPVFVAFFKDFDRWSHEGVLRRIAGEATTVTTWPMVQLREVVTDLENGWSPKCLDRPAEAEEWGVLKVSAASAGFYRETENKALPVSLRPRPTLEIRAGDVLITRASGVANLVGVSTYVESTQEKLLLCDKLFRIVFRPNSQIDPRFLAVVLRLNSVRSQIVREFSTQSGMMKNVSKPILLSLVFPLPPLDDQLTLIEALETTRAAAKGLRAEAAAARVGARAAFEEAVYAVEPAKGGDIEPTRKAPVSGRA